MGPQGAMSVLGTLGTPGAPDAACRSIQAGVPRTPDDPQLRESLAIPQEKYGPVEHLTSQGFTLRSLVMQNLQAASHLINFGILH
jgi:hypothetical protein